MVREIGSQEIHIKDERILQRHRSIEIKKDCQFTNKIGSKKNKKDGTERPQCILYSVVFSNANFKLYSDTEAGNDKGGTF